MKEEIKKCHKLIEKTKKEIAKIIVGQESIINSLFIALLANGHVLVEGVPGVAKTLLIKTMATASGCSFSRIQFTVDLLPTDITGITVYTKEKGFTIIKGPIFANFIVADEINRSPPKTQSSLLEAMQERQTTIGKKTFPLPLPFFVMATQNPIETEAVYPLPEAQVDRFLMKLLMYYPNMTEEEEILEKNIELKRFEEYKIKKVLSPSLILKMQDLTKRIYISEDVKKYIVRIVDSTRNPKKYDIKLGKYIEWGGSPRTSIGLFITSKAKALMEGKDYVTPQHVKDVAHEIMRHRIIISYEGQAENIKGDEIIDEILSKVPLP